MLERLFQLTSNKTTVRRELLAGTTTFLTMSYIVFVNPGILSAAGMDFVRNVVVPASSAAPTKRWAR